MNKRELSRAILAVSLLFLTTEIALAQSKTIKGKSADAAQRESPSVTFVELGSVKCIPCRQMQPVMKAVEQKYGDQVKVVFHDVWTEAGRSSGEQYRIRLIPTQVFLDAKGKEFFRHEGFYPEEEIHKLLQTRGLKILRAGK